MEVLTENQNNNNGRLCDKEGRRKKKALLITSKLVAFYKSKNLSNGYIDSTYKK